ncbi:MAG TPA: hypothetical protein VN698_16605, partial [Bacteroidia bacterium]|nr:hypothetical protein [Bacteroidia bacterium]
MAKIKNINGTPQHQTTCKCGSWLNHWTKNGGGIPPTFCIVCAPDCLEKATVGALVQKTNITDNRWYIAPMCETH